MAVSAEPLHRSRMASSLLVQQRSLHEDRGSWHGNGWDMHLPGSSWHWGTRSLWVRVSQAIRKAWSGLASPGPLAHAGSFTEAAG
jgi:hypothetical protein